MRSIFVKALIAIVFAAFVIPSGYELSSQQDPNTKVQQKERKRDGTHDGQKKQKKNKKHKKNKKNSKKVKKYKRNKRGRI